MSSTCCVGTEVNLCAQSDIYSKGGDRPASVTLWSKSPNGNILHIYMRVFQCPDFEFEFDFYRQTPHNNYGMDRIWTVLSTAVRRRLTLTIMYFEIFFTISYFIDFRIFFNLTIPLVIRRHHISLNLVALRVRNSSHIIDKCISNKSYGAWRHNKIQ